MHAATLVTGAPEAPVPGKDAGHADEAEPDIPRGEARDVPDATAPGCPGEAKAGASGGKAHDARGASGGGARRRSGARGNAGEAPGARVGEGNGAGGSGHPQALGRVLVIEDEPGIVDFLRRGLEEEGFAVKAAVDGAEGERLALSCDFDIVVLDLLLPGRGGLEVLAALRRVRPRLPVVVLTARGELEDRVAGLDAGAVDYIVKPVSIVELAARLRAHLRVLADTSTTLRGAGIEVELLTRTVRRDGEPVSLSSTEFDLLAYMLRNQGEVLSREQLLCAVWGPEHGRETNVVDVYIGYLRRKLAAPGGVPPISTVRAVGYRFGETA